jgi:hypothetical protein
MKSIPITYVLGTFFKDGEEYRYLSSVNTRFLCENLRTLKQIQFSAYDTVQIKDDDVAMYKEAFSDRLASYKNDIAEVERALFMISDKQVNFKEEAIDCIESFLQKTRCVLYAALEKKAFEGSGAVTKEDAEKILEIHKER